MTLQAFKSRDIESYAKVEPATAQPVTPKRIALDTISHGQVVPIESALTETGSTASVIVSTSHPASVGDIILFADFFQSSVIAVTLNSFTLGQVRASNPGANLAFLILRYAPKISNLTILIDDTTIPLTYIGKAAPGTLTSAASWQISKLNATTGTVMTWADGNCQFDNIYDNRAGLTYA